MSRSYTVVCIPAAEVVEILGSRGFLPRRCAEGKYFAGLAGPSGKMDFPEIGNSTLGDLSQAANYGNPGKPPGSQFQAEMKHSVSSAWNDPRQRISR